MVNTCEYGLCRASREPVRLHGGYHSVMAEGYSHFDVYGKFGLRESPFNVHALLADERGQRLMVGRDTELHQVVRKLQIGTGIVCLDGHPGIGKTSLVNVAAKRCLDLYTGGQSPNLILPLHDSMQLSKTDTIDGFCASALRKVAAALLRYRHSLGEGVPSREGNDVEAWLTSPVARIVSETVSGSASAGFPGVVSLGATGSRTESPSMNTGTGYSQYGFEAQVKAWLTEIFGAGPNKGGVVCVIDNLEILETGAEATNFLDALRDRLLLQPGLRWVFCGASGVINGLAASPRLRSFLSHPVIKVESISPSQIEPLVRARLREFSADPLDAEARLPIGVGDLKRLYTILNFNLRDLLQYPDQFCDHWAALGYPQATEEAKAHRFGKWLKKESEDTYRAISGYVPEDAWNLLDTALSDQFQGTFGLGNYKQFNASTSVTVSEKKFKAFLNTLVKHGLLTRSVEDDREENDPLERRTYRVTAKGAMIHYARILSNARQSFASYDWLKTVVY